MQPTRRFRASHSMTPFVASEGFNALCRNKALCVPGTLAKTIVFATRLAPRGFVARTAAALQRPRKKK